MLIQEVPQLQCAHWGLDQMGLFKVTVHKLSRWPSILLKEGEVVERGTHDELLAVGGEYAAMWHQQSTAGNNDGGEKDANAKKEE